MLSFGDFRLLFPVAIRRWSRKRRGMRKKAAVGVMGMGGWSRDRSVLRAASHQSSTDASVRIGCWPQQTIPYAPTDNTLRPHRQYPTPQQTIPYAPTDNTLRPNRQYPTPQQTTPCAPTDNTLRPNRQCPTP
jgi:hypothetical protein